MSCRKIYIIITAFFLSIIILNAQSINTKSDIVVGISELSVSSLIFAVDDESFIKSSDNIARLFTNVVNGVRIRKLRVLRSKNYEIFKDNDARLYSYNYESITDVGEVLKADYLIIANLVIGDGSAIFYAQVIETGTSHVIASVDDRFENIEYIEDIILSMHESIKTLMYDLVMYR